MTIDVNAVLESGLIAAEKWEGASGERAELYAEQATGALILLNTAAEHGLLPAAWLSPPPSGLSP